MAVYRSVYTTFWKDTKIVDEFTPEDKYFMLYCLTNDYTNLCGCFEISIKQMERDTGYNIETIERLLKRFSDVHGVVFYNKENKELFIKNWHKYNWTKSEKLDKPLLTEIENVKTLDFKRILMRFYCDRDTVSIPYPYPMDTTVSVYNINNNNFSFNNNSINNIEKENILKEKEKTKTNFDEIVNLYNEYCYNLPKISKLTDKRKTAIRKFLKEFTIEDFKKICCLANENDFLTGDNDRNWKADFDFLLRTDKATAILENKYSNKRDKMDDFVKLWEGAKEKDEQQGNSSDNNFTGW